MKGALLLLLLFILGGDAFNAQVAERIYGKNKVLKPNEYYLEQAALWKLKVEKEPENADAWYNYYRANRNAYIKGEEDNSQKAKGISRFERLKKIVDEMELRVPDSYEFNFVKWLNGNNDLALFPFLEKAHHLSPQSPEPIMSMIFYYEIIGDYIHRDESIEAFYTIGDYSSGLLNYSYNLLSGLEENALLFTEGDKDTEAILLLTKGRKYRPDVRMLNMNLLLINEYRERIFRELEIDPLDFDPMINEENYETFRSVIIERVASNKKEYPVYSAVTVSKPYTDKITGKLYLVGLSYLYSETEFNNVDVLRDNVEQLYMLDYLDEYFELDDISVGNVNSMNGNYLLPFVALSEYYTRVGDRLRARHYKDLARKVAEASERLEEYRIYFAD